MHPEMPKKTDKFFSKIHAHKSGKGKNLLKAGNTSKSRFYHKKGILKMVTELPLPLGIEDRPFCGQTVDLYQSKSQSFLRDIRDFMLLS